MLVFWQECKHILRSKFFWVVLVLGVALSINSVYTNFGYIQNGDPLTGSISLVYAFTEKHGTSFTEKDAEEFVKYYMTETEQGKEFVRYMQEYSGLKSITPEEVIKTYHNEPTELGTVIQKMEEEGNSEENADYANLIYSLGVLQRPLKIAENNSLDPEQYNTKEWGKDWLEASGKDFPKWQQEMILDGYDRLGERVEEIGKNGENHQMMPFIIGAYENRDWFRFQFGTGAITTLWAFAFVLAGIAAARSLGGSLMNHMESMLYTGKKGRKLVWQKIMAVLVVSGSVYLALYLLVTVFYVSLFRLDLYWNIPLASMVDYDTTCISRFALTVGGYWWFQLGIGLGAVCIMALVYSAAMVLTKSFYAGSAISVGLSVFVLLLIQIMPAMRNSLLVMSTPIGLYLNVGNFAQPQSFLFAILPNFEGLSLLVWGGFAAVLVVLGFVRFRKTAL